MFESARGTVYELTGPQDAAVVVLIHGLGMNRKMWRDCAEALSDQFRVLAYDLAGHGESSLPSHMPSLSLFSSQLRHLIAELNIDSCSAVGFSLGGMINRRFAIDYPECTDSLIILNSPHQRDEVEQKLIEQRVADTSDGGPQATLQTSLERWFTPEFMAAESDIVNEVGSWILRNDPAVYTQCRKVLAAGVKELIDPQPPIRIPTLIMTCEFDSGSTPWMSQSIAKEIENSKCVIVPRLQHMGLMEKPDLFISPIREFLADVLN